MIYRTSTKLNPAYDDPRTITNTRISSDRNSNKRYQLTRIQLINISTPYKLISLVMRMYNKQLLLFMRL